MEKTQLKKLAFYVFVDAFGYESYKQHGFMKNTIKDIHPLKTVFGFSSAADPSILTGRYPDEHGHWSSFYYSPKTSPFKTMKYFSFLPKKIFDRWRIRHWLSKIIAKIYRFTGYFEMYNIPFKYLPYFDYLEKQDYFVPGGILQTDTIFDHCSENDIPYHCSNWRLPEENNIEIAKNIIQEGNIKFLYLYLPKLDAVMHQYGTEHNKVKEKLLWLEEELIKLLAIAKKTYDEINFYVISDHGMTNITNSVDLISQINKEKLDFGKDYIAMYDSTMARFWFLNNTAKEKITAILSNIKEGYIVPEKELKDMHTFFKDHKFGELYFLMHPGTLINPSYMGSNLLAGMHGFHPNDKSSDALIMANKKIAANINSITDIRKTMEMELKQ